MGHYSGRSEPVAQARVGLDGRPMRRPHQPKAKPRSGGLKPRRSPTQERAFAQRLVMMVKEPKAGNVKTRLARSVGAGRAANFYRKTTDSVFSRLSRAPQWETYLAISPDAAISSSAWPTSTHRVGQGSGDLGKRMQRVMDGMPAGPVVIVGTDSPAVTASHVQKAFVQLGNADAVIGPAPDGGYWLVGLKRRPSVPRAFQSVRWSSSDALSDTMANLEDYKVAKVDELLDVDELEDLKAVQHLEGRRVLPVGASFAPY